VLWQHTGRALHFQRQIRHVERVIHDEYLRCPSAPDHLEEKALAIAGASLLQAVAAIALDCVPHLRKRRKAQVGPRPVLGLPRPLKQLCKLVRVLSTGRGTGPCHRRFEPADADVIGPALNEKRRKFPRYYRPEKWKILPDQLFLKIYGSRSHDNLFAQFRCGKNCRDQVAEAFADTRSGLDHEVAIGLDGAGHRFRHLELFPADLITRKARRDRATRAEQTCAVDRHRRLPM
jgi:hypothetical protein